MEPGTEIELKEVFAVFEMPEDVVLLDIEAVILQDGETMKVLSHMDRKAVNEGFYEAREGYLPGITEIPWEEVDNYEPVRDHIILSIPEDTVALTLRAKLVVSGELKEREYYYGVPKIREAVDAAERDYIPTYATFTLTEKGMEEAKRLLEEQS